MQGCWLGDKRRAHDRLARHIQSNRHIAETKTTSSSAPTCSVIMSEELNLSSLGPGAVKQYASCHDPGR